MYYVIEKISHEDDFDTKKITIANYFKKNLMKISNGIIRRDRI